MPSQGVLTRALFAHASGLEDSPFWQFLDAAPDDSHSSNGTDNSRHKSSQGQGKGKTPYGSMAGDNSPGSFDYAPIILLEKGGRRGAPLRMTAPSMFVTTDILT